MRSLLQQRFVQGGLRLRTPCVVKPSRRRFWFRASADREPRCIHQGFSHHNEIITVLEIPDDPVEQYRDLAGARLLLLDQTGNLHSIYRRDQVLTGCYWDVLAALPSVVPPGPLGLMGLGAGTVARIMAAAYPAGRHVVHGWELDAGVVMVGRLHLGMQELESTGRLVAHTGDALDPEATVPGGFSGIVVDLFGGGRLLPQLTKRDTWEALRSRLDAAQPGARVIVNLGQSPPSAPGTPWQPEAYTTLRAYEALEAAFEGDVSLMSVQGNTLALTGPTPPQEEWPGRLPEGLNQLGGVGPWTRGSYPLQGQGLSM